MKLIPNQEPNQVSNQVSNQDPKDLSIQPMVLPNILQTTDDHTKYAFLQFFAEIENDNTRKAYARALKQFFSWCEAQALDFHSIHPIAVAAYFKQHPGSKPTRKQHLAAVRKLYDWLVSNAPNATFNPAASTRGPKHVVKTGKTPVLTQEETRALFNSIDTSTLKGLRDRAILGILFYAWVRVSALTKLNRADYYSIGKRHFIEFQEKGGKRHTLPLHHKAQEYLDAYLDQALILDKDSPLFRSMNRKGDLSPVRLERTAIWRMLKKRAVPLGYSERITTHTPRATGITTFIKAGGKIEEAQLIANHADPRTTKLYDKTKEAIELSLIESVQY